MAQDQYIEFPAIVGKRHKSWETDMKVMIDSQQIIEDIGCCKLKKLNFEISLYHSWF